MTIPILVALNLCMFLISMAIMFEHQATSNKLKAAETERDRAISERDMCRSALAKYEEGVR